MLQFPDVIDLDCVTVVDHQGDLMEVIAAAQAEDVECFVALCERLNWRYYPAGDFVAIIRLALAVGAHLTARELATLGRTLYPTHAELAQIAHVLAPPRAKRGAPASAATRRKDFDWLRNHAAPYRGQWVALKDGELVAAAATVAELRTHIARPEDVFLARVP